MLEFSLDKDSNLSSNIEEYIRKLINDNNSNKTAIKIQFYGKEKKNRLKANNK